MSARLLIGLVSAEMDEKGYVFVKGKGWIHKEEAAKQESERMQFTDFTPEREPRKKRKYKK